MNQRSTSQRLQQICRSLEKPSRKAELTRKGTPRPTAIQLRQQDPSNFRDMSDPVHHLTYHVCPFRDAHHAWTWNFMQLQKRWGLFNGKKILGINYDQSTASPAEVIHFCQSIGLEWDDIVISLNSKTLGEVMTWVQSLEKLPMGEATDRDIVFSAHAKGVKYNGDSPPVVRNWTDVMYRSNLDYMENVHSSLEWFSSAGSFRCRNSVTPQSRYGWHYSGAFWWWRLSDLAKRDWRIVGQTYAGREFWIGNHIARAESDCLFMDRCRSPYNPDYWAKVIHPRWAQWEAGNAR